MNGLALFDMDGTITRGDTMLAFMRRLLGVPHAAGALLGAAPGAAASLLRLADPDSAKRSVIRRVFAGRSAAQVQAVAQDFARIEMARLARPAAMDRIQWHRSLGHRVVVVSAGCGAWLGPWCRMHGAELIATELEVDAHGRYTGALATANCKGPEKVARIRAAIDPGAYQEVHAYGDTRWDEPMLALATHPHRRPFR